MFKLLADMMMFVLKAPFAFMNFLNQFMFQRMITQKALSSTKDELRSVSKIGKFFAFVGFVFLWLLLIGILLGCLFLLWYVNDVLNLEQFLGGPWPFLRAYWLPLLLVLLCISSFIGYQLYRSLGPDRDIVEFTDLEEAWAEAKSTLIEAGIDLRAVPLFLILGRTASSLHALMSATRMTYAVQQIPLKANAPLQVYANRQGIFVVLPDACLLGRQTELLFEAAETPEKPLSKPAIASVFEEDDELFAVPEVASKPVMEIDPLLTTQNLLVEPAPGAGVGLLPAIGQEKDSIPWMYAGHRRMPALRKKTEEVEKYQRRLNYIARRIGRDRAPFCSLNGILLLVPFEGLENDEDASQIASLCQSDLQALHDTARVSCPVMVLITDLETAPGYAALSKCLDLDRRLRLFGQDLPLLPDLKGEEMPRMIEMSVQHFGDALSQWIFRLLSVERSEKEQAADHIQSSSQLFELLGAIRQREQAIERILMRILTSSPALEFMVGGFYLAATGANPDREQVFVPGVFQQLIQNQNAVAWTREALTEEADYQRWTTYGYAALAIFLIVVVLLIYGRWQMLQSW